MMLLFKKKTLLILKWYFLTASIIKHTVNGMLINIMLMVEN